jgi:hypothetical protein
MRKESLYRLWTGRLARLAQLMASEFGQSVASSGDGVIRKGKMARHLFKSEVMTLEKLERRSQRLTLLSAQLVSKQLGYVPYNLVDVGSSIRIENADGSDGVVETIEYPLAAICYPLNSNNNLCGRYHKDGGLKPFPTVLWMTCPILHARISKLEGLGFITSFQQRLEASEEYIAQMKEAHRRYAEFRCSLLTAEDNEFAIASGWRDRFYDVGIAGIRNFTTVKCLHCHYSHHLCRPEDGNVVGTWIQEELDKLSQMENGVEDERMQREMLALYKQTIASVENQDNLVPATIPDVNDEVATENDSHCEDDECCVEKSEETRASK